jgi:mevalonate kinase
VPLQNDFLVLAETERAFMNPKSMVAILMMVTAPVYAQAQKPTRADAQRVFEIISGNEVKTQIFCDIGKLGDEIEQAAEKKDTRTADELRRKIDELGRKLGPEYAALMNGIQDVDPESEDGQQISSTIQALDKLCALE